MFEDKKSLIDDIYDDMFFVINTNYKKHPFSKYVTINNFDTVISDYLTMSRLFPYIQAKSIGDALLNSLKLGKIDLDKIELTSVVGTFLVSDEFGIYNNACLQGNKGLVNILNVERNFHYHFLMNDMKNIKGYEIIPNYSKVTMDYLDNLLQGLSNLDDVVRCATMVAFECHAENMILSLWNKVSELFPNLNKDDLKYFHSHVGGEDPAEQYHVLMTKQMIKEIVNLKTRAKFMIEFEKAYKANFEWCETISPMSIVDNN